MQTDLRGEFKFGAVETGGYTISTSAAHYAPNTLALRLEEVADETEFPSIELELEPGGAATKGSVVDALGGPIPDGTVIVTEAWRSSSFGVARTNSSGEFTVYGAAGPVKVSVEADGYAGASRVVTAPASNLRFALAPAASVAGMVVEEGSNRLIAGARVAATCQNGFEASSESDSNGHFELKSLLPGPCELQAVAERWRSDPVGVALGVGERVESLRIAVVPGALVGGQVVLDGNPCALATLTLSGPSVLRSAGNWEGKVQIGGVPAGRWTLQIECKDAVALREDITLSTDSAFERTWKVSRGLEVSGRVLTSDGADQEGVLVRIEDATGTRRTGCISGASGDFLCSGLESGSYEASATNQWGALGPAVPVVLSDRSIDGVALKLQPAGDIAVSVVSLDGEPRDDMPVFASCETGSPMQAQPIGSGDFQLQNVAPGNYVVSVGNPGGSATARVVVSTGRKATATLRVASAAAIEGTVVDERRDPVADAWVTADAVSGVGDGHAAPVLSDADGVFRITGLLSGSYDLKATTTFGSAEALGVRTGSRAELRVSGFASVGGSVVDDGNRPVDFFTLSYERADGMGGEQDVSNSGGRWFVDKLRPGTWLIRIRSNSGYASQRVDLSPAQSLELQLSLRQPESTLNP